MGIRTKLLLGLVVLSVWDQRAAATPRIYQLSISAQGCRLSLHLNGFPLAQDSTSETFSLPVNVFLVGKDNRLRLDAKAKGSAKCRWSLEMTGVSQGDAQSIGVLEEQGGGPGELNLTFETPVDVFSKWTRGPVLRDTKALAPYGQKLVELVRKGDAAGLLAELAPKHADYAAAFGASEAAFSSSIRQMVDDVKEKLAPLRAGQVVFEPLLGGRLYRLGSKERPKVLLWIKQADGEFSFEVVVGQVDGKLRIVR